MVTPDTQIHARRLPGLLLQVALVVLLLAGAVFVLPGATQAQSEIEVIDNTAVPNFPQDITFSLAIDTGSLDVVEIDLLYGAARSESRTVVPVDVTPGQRIEVEHVLNTQIFHLPVGVDLNYNWLIRDAAGNEIETAEQSVVYFDERFDWQQLTERGVTVYWYAGGDAFGEELMQMSLRTLDRLEEEIDATVDESVKIFIYADTADMRAALRQNSVDWVGGQAVPSLGLIIGAIAPGNSDEVARLIPHELSHQVLHQAVENPYGGTPLWFDEGLAVYNQEIEDWMFPQMINEAARGDTIISLSALAASFPTDTNRALLSYAQSADVVEYLFDTYGNEKVEQLVQQFSEAVPVEEALPAVLDITVEELHAEWRETLPPAETSVELEGSPQVAPPDRFSGEPVLPRSGDPSAEPATIAGVATYADVETNASQPVAQSAATAAEAAAPRWTGWLLVAGGATGMLGVTGVVLLFARQMTK